MNKTLPSPELLRKLLRYDPKTGKLFWRERVPNMFEGGKGTPEHSCAKWNARFSGTEAFTSIDSKGYLMGCVNCFKAKSHRVIWAMHYDQWPINQIDHINGVRYDNRIENLRLVTNRQNARNQRKNTRNTSGFVGVYYCKASQKWKGQINDNNGKRHLGYFRIKSDAIAAVKNARSNLGYHENHGRG